jgi:hypothetical protein
MGGSEARSHADTDPRNDADLFSGCPHPIDQRHLTNGVDYDRQEIDASGDLPSLSRVE